MNGRWLPRAAGVGVVATVLVLAVLNPDAYIARHNVERFEQTGRIDVHYLGDLSGDAVSELDRLPEPERGCVRLLADNELLDRQWYPCDGVMLSVP